MGTYLVTGGASGIGAAVRDRLLADGAEVVVVDLPGDERQAAVEATGAAFVGADLSEPERAAELVGEAVTGPLAGMVLAAGISEPGSFPAIRAEDWERVYRINVEAPMLLTQRLHDRLGAGGAIVLIASVEGTTVLAPRRMSTPAYASSKAAVISLTAALAYELGPRGIRVNAVSPGLTRTPMAARIVEGHADWYEASSALRRIVEPHEIAAVVAFLLGDEAAVITGQTIVADAGLTIAHAPPALPGS